MPVTAMYVNCFDAHFMTILAQDFELLQNTLAEFIFSHTHSVKYILICIYKWITQSCSLPSY